MPRKQKITELMTYVIKSKEKEGVSVEEIVEFINTHFMTNYSLKDIQNILTPESKPKKPNHMINKTASGEKGVSVMTKAQSEYADEARFNSNKPNNYLKKSIHKISKDEEN